MELTFSDFFSINDRISDEETISFLTSLWAKYIRYDKKWPGISCVKFQEEHDRAIGYALRQILRRVMAGFVRKPEIFVFKK